MNLTPGIGNSSKKLGIVIGGSGLIGGGLTHYFSKQAAQEFDILAPNSKRLSLRVKEDVGRYFRQFRPDFIINAAIAAIDSDPQLAFETNYLGSINLARVALTLGIPYIHLSTAAVLPAGENVREEDLLPLTGHMSNYAKSKLMCELTLQYMQRELGLDCTVIRLGVVYGKHDHKIQGVHRLLFSVADQSMPLLLTSPTVRHSYTNTKKVPGFIHHLLENRAEFSGQTYNFVDRLPVQLVRLILTTKSYLQVNTPQEVYVPYPVARFGKTCLKLLIRVMGRIGVEVRMPAELMFLQNFYKTQILSAEKLAHSSYVDPEPNATIFTELPDLLEYYLTRWEHLNLISSFNKEFFDPKKQAGEFHSSPETLLESLHQSHRLGPLTDFQDLL
ncbi:MAG: epimerase [Deltaproteobacteria bacterium RIFOXYD12_FULL_57_12]|nr:MAG: epimerase [Deltaproteobacteria bacterium RIFOXYD12_FULL_57_12]